MRRGRLGFSAIDKREIWSRWKAGQTLHEIGRAYGKCHNTIRAVLLPRGGIPPLARRRSRLALTFAERARGHFARDGFRFFDRTGSWQTHRIRLFAGVLSDERKLTHRPFPSRNSHRAISPSLTIEFWMTGIPNSTPGIPPSRKDWS
jgi:hypothetical protein